MATYTTKSGDTWDGIAYRQLGTEALTDTLMNVNAQYLSYYTFPAGVVLTLPEIEEEVSTLLPPWKR